MMDEVMITEQKAILRENILKKPPTLDALPEYSWGKAAERIRRLPMYHSTRTIFASLGSSLHQVKLNILADQKSLVLPTPGLQKGFVLLDPKAIPVKKRSYAVRVDPNNPFAQKIPYDRPSLGPIQMMVTGAVAVGEDGSLLGDGLGHFDIQHAILRALGWLAPEVVIVAVASEEQVHPSLPTEPTDVGAHWIVTPKRAFATSYKEPPHAGIVWEKIPEKSLRRNDALFFLHHRKTDSALPR